MKFVMEFESNNSLSLSAIQKLIECLNRPHKIKMTSDKHKYEFESESSIESIKNIVVNGVKFDKNCKEIKE